jgi:hypothetical protein
VYLPADLAAPVWDRLPNALGCVPHNSRGGGVLTPTWWTRCPARKAEPEIDPHPASRRTSGSAPSPTLPVVAPPTGGWNELWITRDGSDRWIRDPAFAGSSATWEIDARCGGRIGVDRGSFRRLEPSISGMEVTLRCESPQAEAHEDEAENTDYDLAAEVTRGTAGTGVVDQAHDHEQDYPQR